MDYEEAFEQIRKELYGTGIPAVRKGKAQQGELPSGLAIVVGGADTLALSFKKREVGKIIRTQGRNGDLWQARDIDTIASKDLHRVVFELAAYHPPFDDE